MKVTLATCLEVVELASWSRARIDRYKYDRRNLGEALFYEVLGIVFAANRTLLFIDNPACCPRVGLYDHIIFDVQNRSVSTDWVVYPHVSSANIAHEDVVFRDFSYIGLDKLITEEGFYERYFDGGEAEVQYIENRTRDI